MKCIVLDSESDGLWEEATKIHVLKSLLYDAESGKVYWKVRGGTKRKTGEDAGFLCTRKNRRTISLTINGKHKVFQTARIAWLLYHGEWPRGSVDHIDGNSSNDKIVNLRDIPQRLNMMNTSKRVDNTSGFKGVSQIKKSGKWRAYIVLNQKQIHLGCFSTKEEASKAYNQASEKYHGVFGRKNPE